MDMKQQGLEREARDNETEALVPPVDIVEDEDGITLKADLPGASRESLSIGVNGDTLSLEAAVGLGESTAMQPLYAEVRVAQYKRSFVLSRDLDAGKIDARLHNGVLQLRIPKSEQAKPRRIPVRVD